MNADSFSVEKNMCINKINYFPRISIIYFKKRKFDSYSNTHCCWCRVSRLSAAAGDSESCESWTSPSLMSASSSGEDGPSQQTYDLRRGRD